MEATKLASGLGAEGPAAWPRAAVSEQLVHLGTVLLGQLSALGSGWAATQLAPQSESSELFPILLSCLMDTSVLGNCSYLSVLSGYMSRTISFKGHFCLAFMG